MSLPIINVTKNALTKMAKISPCWRDFDILAGRLARLGSKNLNEARTDTPSMLFRVFGGPHTTLKNG